MGSILKRFFESAFSRDVHSTVMAVHPPVFALVQAEDAKRDDVVSQAKENEVPSWWCTVTPRCPNQPLAIPSMCLKRWPYHDIQQLYGFHFKALF